MPTTAILPDEIDKKTEKEGEANMEVVRGTEGGSLQAVRQKEWA